MHLIEGKERVDHDVLKHEMNVAKPARAMNTQATAVTKEDRATGSGGGVSIGAV
jgi:hypothetical protein